MAVSDEVYYWKKSETAGVKIMSEHKIGCMCDKCITARVREEVSQRGTKKLANDYIRRRGGDNFPKEVPAPPRPEVEIPPRRSKYVKLG